MPTTRSPRCRPVPAGASMTCPSDSWPITRRSAPAGAWPYSPLMISRSVPQTPTARVSTSTGPAASGGSGMSVSATESRRPGTTVIARIFGTELSRPRRLGALRDGGTGGRGNAFGAGDRLVHGVVERKPVGQAGDPQGLGRTVLGAREDEVSRPGQQLLPVADDDGQAAGVHERDRGHVDDDLTVVAAGLGHEPVELVTGDEVEISGHLDDRVRAAPLR